MHTTIVLLFCLLSRLFYNEALAQTVSLNTSEWSALLADGSGVLQSLRPSLEPDFDFSPSDYFQYRDGPGQYHTGDLTLRYRLVNESQWLEANTAATRNGTVAVVPSTANQLTSSLNAALSNVEGFLNVSRTWTNEDNDITLSFTLENVNSRPIEIGSLGMPLEFNNIFVNRTATETTDKCVLLDPFIGLHAGYVQVTRLTGYGPHLVVTPLGNLTKFEAWRFLEEPTDTPLGYQIQTFEGNYEYQVYTKAYAEQEWNGTTPWNTPTSVILAPKESISVGLRFSVASAVEDIETTVTSKGVPLAVGIPGYVIAHDLQGKLYINSTDQIAAVSVSPPNALQVSKDGVINDWQCLTVQSSANAFGRARLDVTFTDGRIMTIHYYVADSGPGSLSSLGNFLTTDQWYTNESDPFYRAPSVISYDYSVRDYVLQDNRTWIAGLSDEGGAGSFLAAALKQSVQADAAEVRKLEEMVHTTVRGHLQIVNGSDAYAVRKSLFYYQPDLVPGYEYSDEFDWTSWASWNLTEAYAINRAYDYVHVSSLYWSLYRAGRAYPSILTLQHPVWYLLQSYSTIMAVFANDTAGMHKTAYYNVGLMGETVWGSVLSDLMLENLTNQASLLETTMRYRQLNWSGEADPFGSEMAWDSTGQEGVYYWSKYFGDSKTVNYTIDSIRGYMPTVAHWGWNGNARRYWDFLYAGKLARIERQIHHYGSGLNALPMLSNYRDSPNPSSQQSLHDLRVGYGGIQGSMSNIQRDGFGSMAFHSYPDTLAWDSYSGDYGPNFVGHILGSATYLVKHPIFGWVSFGGNVLASNNTENTDITVEPRDSVRKRVYVAPMGLYVTIDAGTIEQFTYSECNDQLTLSISPQTANMTAESALLRFEQTHGNGSITISGRDSSEVYGGYRLVFRSKTEVNVTLHCS